MNRFSVIYLFRKQYHHIYCTTHQEAEAALADLLTQEGCKPLGIYDAKTELFVWEPTRQHQYDSATIERQGRIGEQINRIAQDLRQHDKGQQRPMHSLSQLFQTEDL